MKTDRERLIDLCSDLLAGRKGVIEASREMERWRFSVGPEDDADFLIFTAIDSETNHLPLGPVRDSWHPDALVEKDKEIQKVEEFNAAYARKAAANLLEKHKIEPSGSANLASLGG